jgi:predicted ATPase
MTYEFLKEAYREYDYETIDIPPASVTERSDFILAKIASVI